MYNAYDKQLVETTLLTPPSPCSILRFEPMWA